MLNNFLYSCAYIKYIVSIALKNDGENTPWDISSFMNMIKFEWLSFV